MKKVKTLFPMLMGLVLSISTNLYADFDSKELPPETTPFFHNETVGTFVFEKYADNLLLLTARVEKKHFTYALQKEGTCSPKDMMRICGNNYLLENLEVEVNGSEVELKEENLTIEKDFVILSYSIPLEKATFSSIKVSSDYMFKYNDHAILKIVFDLNGPPRSFKIKNKRRTITASFK